MSIRLRLTIWSALFLSAGLLVLSSGVYALAVQALHQRDDRIIAGPAHRLDLLLALWPNDPPIALQPLARAFSSSSVAVMLLDANGRVLASTPGVRLPAPSCDSRCAVQRGGSGFPVYRLAGLPITSFYDQWPSFYDQSLAGRPFRVVVMRHAGGPVRYVLVGHSVQGTLDTIQSLRTLLLGGSVLCLILVSIAVTVLVRAALAPLAALTRTAAHIAESGDFAARLPAPPRRDEVGQLAATFNAMLRQLAEFHLAQRRFVSDASHELRAPLAIIRGNVEFLQLDSRLPAEERDAALSDLAAEAARLSRLVDGLLALARGDARQCRKPKTICLHDLLRSTCREMQARPDIPAVEIAHCEAVVAYADPDRLEQLLIILLDNAIKYTPARGTIRCSLRAEGNQAVLTISDTGIGIDPGDLPHIFERFYRADRARAREVGTGLVPGAGLGLSIAQQIVQEAGGSISATSVPGQGATFTVYLPIVSVCRAERTVG